MTQASKSLSGDARTSAAPVSVLFVCMGNICRSPAAEGVFRHYVAQQRESRRFHIDSAGTIGYHAGNQADQRMRNAAANRGYTLDSVARQVIATDLDRFDLIIAMDLDNLSDLQALARNHRAAPDLRLLGSFLPEYHGASAQAPEVPDPYYGGAQGFEQVLDMIERACPGIYAACPELP